MPIDVMTLLLTWRCNLACTYCHRVHPRKQMPLSTALSAVDMIFAKGVSPKGLRFMGGEPLLAFDTLRAAVMRAEGRSRDAGIPVRFTIATNGTLADEATIDFLIEHRFKTVLSINGRAKTHDLWRVDARGGGSWAKLKGKVALFKKIPRKDLVVSFAIHPAAVATMREDFMALVDLGFDSIEICSIYGSQWDAKSVLWLEKGFGDILRYVLQQAARGRFIVLNNVGEMLKLYTRSARVYQAGDVQLSTCPREFRLHVFPDGSLTLSPFGVRKEVASAFTLGNVGTRFKKDYRGCEFSARSSRCRLCLRRISGMDGDHGKEYMKSCGQDEDLHGFAQQANMILCDSMMARAGAQYVFRKAAEHARFRGYLERCEEYCDLP